MKIKSFTINSKAVYLNVPDMDFTEYGIYQITGKNGSGKTSLIKYILNNSTLHQEIDWRGKIAYCSQNNRKYSVEISDFLRVSYGEVNDLFEKLNLSEEIYDKNLMAISGGELVKLHIIRTVLIGAHLLIFDEPTNNLDNHSVKLFNTLIEELAKHHAILIISHDPRIQLSLRELYSIHGDRISREVMLSEKNTKKNYGSSQSKRFSPQIYSYILFSRFNLKLLIIFSLLATLIIFTANTILLDRLPLNESLERDEYLEILDVYEVCGNYARSVIENTRSGEACLEPDYLDTRELNYLSSLSYINEIYIVDTAYFNDIRFNSRELPFFSLPYFVATSPNYTGSYPGGADFFLYGRIPQDDKSEFAASEYVLRQDLNYSGEIADAIGKSFTVNGGEYKLTGIISLDCYVLSFDDEISTGVFIYDELSYEAMLDSLMIQGIDNPTAQNLFINYDVKFSKELMEYLAKHGKSYQYVSNYVDNILITNSYYEILPWTVLFGLGGSGLVLCLFTMIVRESEKNINSYIGDMNDLNFKPAKNRSRLLLVILLDYTVVSVSVFLVTYVIMEMVPLRYLLIPVLLPFIITVSYLLLRQYKND